MGVVLVVVRHVVVQHEADVVDVDAACGDIGGHEGLQPTPFEVLEDTLAHGLTAGAVQRTCLDTGAVQVF